MNSRGLWRFAAAFCVASLHAARASADDEVCTRAYVETQRLQRLAQFRAARREAVACGQDTCSPTVRAQCSEWLASIERALPTLVIDARDGVGAALADVRVEANGELLAERLNGRALELDPGEYLLRFRYEDETVEQRTLIRESEKYRTLEVRFGGTPEPIPTALAASSPAPLPSSTVLVASSTVPLPSSAVPGRDTPTSIPTASYVIGGLGLASLTASAALAVSGYASERQLRKSCAGTCEPKKVDSVRTRYLVADLALGVGVAALAVAAAAWIWAPTGAIGANARISIGPSGATLLGEF